MKGKRIKMNKEDFRYLNAEVKRIERYTTKIAEMVVKFYSSRARLEEFIKRKQE